MVDKRKNGFCVVKMGEQAERAILTKLITLATVRAANTERP